MPDLTEIFTLLFADDVVLISDTVIGLQNQLDVLRRKSNEFGLTVNTDKSKVLVFRLGGHLAYHEKWHIGDDRLEVLNNYKYLGMMFSTKLCTNTALQDLANRAKSAATKIIRTMHKLNSISCDIFFKLFDSQVQPILLYASEVWGMESCDIIENVHLFALKKFLNVSRQTPNTMIYSETGRYSLSINATLRSVKYWLRIIKMPHSRLPRKAYEMMKMRLGVKDNWYTKLKAVLSEHGFEQYCTSERVTNETDFLRSLRQRLIDSFDRRWLEKITGSDRYVLYRLIKPCRYLEDYLLKVDIKVIRNSMIRFRLGISDIYSHRNRFSKGQTNDTCPVCNEDEEDDVHFVLQCPAYEDLRQKYLQLESLTRDLNTLVYLFSNTDDSKTRGIALYIFHASKRRRSAQSTLLSEFV